MGVKIALALLLASAVARADGDSGRADFVEGKRLYEATDYRRAFVSFQQAYVKSGLPEILYNMALCQQQLGDRKQAARLYRNYLDMVPTAPDRTVIQRLITELERPVPEPLLPMDRRLATEKQHGKRWWIWVVAAASAAAALGIGLGVGLTAGSSPPSPTYGTIRVTLH